MAKTKTRKPSTPKSRGRTNGAARGRPKNQDLPGMESRTIKALEDVGAAYADIRDQRMALTKEEAALKASALKLMIKHDKTIYRSASVLIRRIPGEEDLKVRILKPEDSKPPEDFGEEMTVSEEGESDDKGEGEELRPGIHAEY